MIKHLYAQSLSRLKPFSKAKLVIVQVKVHIAGSMKCITAQIVCALFFCVNDVGTVPFPKYTLEAIRIYSKANIVWPGIMSAVRDISAIKKLNAVSQGLRRLNMY